jgi:hypothetical protein
MDAKQINQTFDLVSHVSGLVTIRKNGAYFIGACPICGGRDRFNVKHTQSGDVWICRKCNPDKYHSALDFLMALHSESFTDALKRAGGEVQAPRRVLGTGKPVQAPAPVQVLPGETWQRDAWQMIDKAFSRLQSEAGGTAREYIASRGISRGSIFMHLLGFAMIGKRPAIVIPWLDVGEVVTAVKYRYIDQIAHDDKGKRFSMMAGSMPYLFGLQHILESDDTLLFAEGEVNAISVLQTLPRGVSIVSGGADTNGNAALLQALARQYKRVVIWTDDTDKARAIRERMNRPQARILTSPRNMYGVEKWDANQMLQAGYLAEFISAELSAPCDGIPTPAQLAQVTA